MSDEQPVSRLHQLADRFDSLVSRVRGPRIAAAKPPEPTEDERLEAELVNWLRDERPVQATLSWLDTQAARCNASANASLEKPQQMAYALGQEAAFHYVAQRFRIIRSK